MGYTYLVFDDETMKHHGVKGMHWGIRRYQNPDGSLTAAGERRHYAKAYKRAAKYYKNKAKEVRNSKSYQDANKALNETISAGDRKAYNKQLKKTKKEWSRENEYLFKAHDSKNVMNYMLGKYDKTKVSDVNAKKDIERGKKFIDEYLKLENGDKNFYKKNQKSTKKEILKKFPMLNDKNTKYEYDEYGRVVSARNSK